jgi:hypothetical protein
MAYGAASFAQGLMGGLQTGLALADVRKESKREKIAAQVAKERVAADGVKTFDAAELQGQEHLIAGVAEGMTPQQKAEYASMRRVPLGIEKTPEMVYPKTVDGQTVYQQGAPEVNLGAIPTPNINARTEAQKFNRPQAALPAPTVTPTPPMAAQNAPAPQGYAMRDGQVEYTGPGAIAAEVEGPKYQVYKDTFGRDRYTTKLRDRTSEEIAFDTATRLQRMGDIKGAEQYMEKYDRELERTSKKQARDMGNGLRQLNAGLLTGNSELMSKGLTGIFSTMQNNSDGVTYDMVRSPDGNQITLMGVDTATGLPLPPSVKDAPPGTIAVFKADPAAGLPVEAVMAGQLSSLATPEGNFNYTKQVMLGRAAVADLAYKQSGTELNKVEAELRPKKFALDEKETSARIGFEGQRVAIAAARAQGGPGGGGSSGGSGSATKAQGAWDKSVNGYVAKVMSSSGLQPGTPEFNRAAANARNGAIQIFGPPPGAQFFDATGGAPAAAPAQATPRAGGAPAAIPAPSAPKPASAQELKQSVAAVAAATKKAADLKKRDTGWLWQINANNRIRSSINDAVATAKRTGKPEYQQGRQEREETYRKRVANALGLKYPE